MEFSGTASIEDATTEEVWLALSDPIMIKQALPGCAFVVRLGDREEFEAAAERAPEEDPETLPEAEPEEKIGRAHV